MNIDKAIEILTIHNDHNPNFTDAQRREAHQLGIEALKRIQKGRAELKWPFADRPLPGETVDQRLANIGYGSSEALKRH